MTIECYHSECGYHSVHTFPDDGPFCYQSVCRVAIRGTPILTVNGQPQNIFALTFHPTYITLAFGRFDRAEATVVAPLAWWNARTGTFVSDGKEYTWSQA